MNNVKILNANPSKSEVAQSLFLETLIRCVKHNESLNVFISCFGLEASKWLDDKEYFNYHSELVMLATENYWRLVDLFRQLVSDVENPYVFVKNTKTPEPALEFSFDEEFSHSISFSRKQDFEIVSETIINLDYSNAKMNENILRFLAMGISSNHPIFVQSDLLTCVLPNWYYNLNRTSQTIYVKVPGKDESFENTEALPNIGGCIVELNKYYTEEE